MISVIVPIYNTANHLKTCIKSILHQTYEEFELILVNDGSTDNSLAICEKYAKSDHRIVIINKKNEGVDKARFSGISIARGNYITFVDSDDWVQPDMLRVMSDLMNRHNADYIEVAMQRVMDRFKLLKAKNYSPVLGLVEQPRLFNDYYISFFGVNLLNVSMWGKLYNKETLDKAGLKPSGLKMGEDLFFNLMLFPDLNKIYISDYIGYNYRFGGMTNKYNPALFPDLKFLYKRKKGLIDKYSYYKANDYIIYELINVLKSDIQQRILYNYCNRKKIVEDIEQELCDVIWDDIKEIGNKKYLEKDVPKAILAKDAEHLYSICDNIVKSQRLKWRMKRAVSWALSDLL